MASTKITVLISGSGTNLQALIDATKSGSLSGSIIRVISSTKNAYGLERARNAGIDTLIHAPFQYKKKDPENWREQHGKDLAELILKDGPDIIVCAGWMLVLPSTFLTPIENAKVPIINLHPALPKQFDGANAIQRAHEAWMEGKIEKTGVMIHYVIEQVDRGEPILIKEIPFEPDDKDIDKLEERIHRVEHGAIVEATQIAIDRLLEERQKGST